MDLLLLCITDVVLSDRSIVLLGFIITSTVMILFGVVCAAHHNKSGSRDDFETKVKLKLTTLTSAYFHAYGVLI